MVLGRTPPHTLPWTKIHDQVHYTNWHTAYVYLLVYFNQF